MQLADTASSEKLYAMHKKLVEKIWNNEQDKQIPYVKESCLSSLIFSA